MNSKKIVVSLLLTIFLVTGSYFFLDQEIALFIQRVALSGRHYSFFSSDIPDTLLLMVCFITVLAWPLYIHDKYKGVYGIRRAFSLFLGISIPLSFCLKSVLKFVFGGINTRYWLADPVARQFHWFHGYENYGGFPSGHMAVFTVLLLGLRDYYPRHRTAYAGFLFALALALILTDYHFLSDVIAGAYLGYIVHYGTRYGLTFVHRP